MNITTDFSIWVGIGYLLGSIPFGLVLCFLAGYGDIRKIGSGNIGATNVLRTGNKTLALLTVLLDASKAGIAAYLAFCFTPNEPYQWLGLNTSVNVMAGLIAGCAGVLGHNFPLWLKFKGGKGVASAFGFILATSPAVALTDLFTWLLVAFTTKYSSLSAITACILTPVYAFFMVDTVHTIFYSAVALLIVIRHHANIRRLLRGEESKIKLKKSQD